MTRITENETVKLKIAMIAHYSMQFIEVFVLKEKNNTLTGEQDHAWLITA